MDRDQQFDGMLGTIVTWETHTHVRVEGEERAHCGAEVPLEAEDVWGDDWCNECFLFFIGGGRVSVRP
jgi:hypothetical protein